MLLKQPYFMTNEDWYYFEKDAKKVVGGKYYLTKLGKSIPKVVQSYNEYYKTLDIPADDLEFINDKLKKLEQDIINDEK